MIVAQNNKIINESISDYADNINFTIQAYQKTFILNNRILRSTGIPHQKRVRMASLMILKFPMELSMDLSKTCLTRN